MVQEYLVPYNVLEPFIILIIFLKNNSFQDLSNSHRGHIKLATLDYQDVHMMPLVKGFN